MAKDGEGRIRDTVERLVMEHAKLPLEHVADEDVLGFELGLDSQALLRLLLAVEDRFAIEVPAEQVGELAGASFRRLADMVERSVAARNREEARS